METLLVLTLSGSLLTLLLLFLRYVLLKKMPSTVYYYAWLLVLLRFLLPLPGLVPSPGAPEESRELPAVTGQNFAYGEETPVFQPVAVSPVTVPAAPAAEKPETAAETAETAAAQPSVPRKTAFSWRSPALWMGLWGAGALVSFGATVLAYLRFLKGLRRDLRQPDAFLRRIYAGIPGIKPRLYVCPGLQTPIMCGVIRPRIILPDRPLEGEVLVNILNHELTHYRRRDTLYKWFAAAVLSLHWFNPLAWMVRREISRACELSCDEQLMRRMGRAEKQSYGNTLLRMAASSALPAGVVATTFSTEKKNLKERLEQIMSYKKSGARLLAAVLAVLLLAGCTMAAGPQSVKEETKLPANAVQVSTVDEFLAAIAPDTAIHLKAGVYDLSTASDYGKKSESPWYRWEAVWGEDGTVNAELVISGVKDLRLEGEGLKKTGLAAVPRYANVIHFVNCTDLAVADLTAGHTVAPGFCSGGVLRLENCSGARITDCGLYGCGTIGVDAGDTTDLLVSGCSIYECSYNAVSLHQCRNARVENCEIYRHGTREGNGPGMALFQAYYCDNFVIYNNRVYENNSQFLLQNNFSKNLVFLSNDVHDNSFVGGVFQFDQYGAVVDGCSFKNNGTDLWVRSNGIYACDVSGKLLDSADFEKMSLKDLDPEVSVTPAPVAAAAEVAPGGSITVATVDELLAAIGPDRTIILESGTYDLSTASSYGSTGGEYWFWQQSYDGPELVIRDVSGLSIQASAADPSQTTLAAIPRYANVLNFSNCQNVWLSGFTCGHTKEPGSCSGGVIYLQGCDQFTVEDMRLFGCGILGLQTDGCSSLKVLRTEIYECSQGAGMFFRTDGISFQDCDIHDVPSPAFVFNQCGDKLWNGKPVEGLNGDFDVDENGELTAPKPGANPYGMGEPVISSVQDYVNPFAGVPEYTLAADSAEVLFASEVQEAISHEDWMALVDRIAFPLQVFTDSESTLVYDGEEYRELVEEGFFSHELFTGPGGFIENVTGADPTVFGSSVFGQTCLSHRISIINFGPEDAQKFYIRAISLVTPLWP